MSKATADAVLAIVLVFPFIAYLFGGSFELVALAYLTVIAHASIKIHDEARK